ncbi:UNVERIFIED_CONTAM: AmiS/UreI family transporter [Kocuria sp. CPCC 205316]|uniref:AmiS/UreI family transporter n=1 Tax=Kocuria TaxID=57493 RepID=UPI0036DCF4FD
MTAVGLLYVGAVLFINGMMLLGHISGTAAAPLNFFVGALQVMTPTWLIVSAEGDSARIAAAAGLYFFGFTYLWLGVNLVTRWPDHGLGWFSLVVAVSGAGFAAHSWVVLGGRVLAVQWLMWSALWGAFFVLMARDRADLAPAVGVLAIGNALLTTGLPGFLALSGGWHDSSALAGSLAALGILLLLSCRPVGRLLAARPRSPGEPPAPRH